VIQLTRCYRFPAAHVLASTALSDAENQRIFGKCANPAGHGHNYGVEISVSGPIDEQTGKIIPDELLDSIFDDTVSARYSHRMLNELPEFERLVPTAENILVVLHDALSEAVSRRSSARVTGVRVVETGRNSFEQGEIR